jgi:hypothetical protein
VILERITILLLVKAKRMIVLKIYWFLALVITETFAAHSVKLPIQTPSERFFNDNEAHNQKNVFEDYSDLQFEDLSLKTEEKSFDTREYFHAVLQCYAKCLDSADTDYKKQCIYRNCELY